MKTILTKLSLLLLFFVLSTTFTFAQDFGDDPEYCKRNLTLYDQYYRQDAYKDALMYWRESFKTCPKSTKNLYIHGAKMYETFIEEATDDAVKSAYVDTLMMIYDKRIEYYGQEGFVRGRQGVDLLKYRISDLETGYGYLKKSVELRKEKSDASVIIVYMQATGLMFKQEKIEAQTVIDTYVQLSDIITAQLQEDPDDGNAKIARENVDKIFEDSGAATCEMIIPIFKNRFEAEPENIDVLKLITRMLDKQGCKDDPLYADAAVNLYDIEPSAEAAINLARLFVKKENWDEAATYYKEAVESDEVDDLTKAQYYYEYAVVVKQQGQYSTSRSLAREAIALNENFGEPYILIGDMYAGTSCGENPIEQKFVYIAAVNKYRQAINATEDESIKDVAQQKINAYVSRYPKREDAFFHSYSEGQSVTVGCWIGETVTVQFSD